MALLCLLCGTSPYMVSYLLHWWELSHIRSLSCDLAYYTGEGPSLITGLDCGLDWWTGLLDWITGSNQTASKTDDARVAHWTGSAARQPWAQSCRVLLARRTIFREVAVQTTYTRWSQSPGRKQQPPENMNRLECQSNLNLNWTLPSEIPWRKPPATCAPADAESMSTFGTAKSAILKATEIIPWIRAWFAAKAAPE